ncbi:hypothetical protein KSS87_020484 [Heliosperma pusillum]|nr:hypothetical protein KSS87_020484 [Heliosperma pusillum]
MIDVQSLVKQHVSEILKDHLQSKSSNDIEITKTKDVSSSQVQNSCHSTKLDDHFIELEGPVPCRLAVFVAESKIVVAEGTVWPWVEGKMVHNTPLTCQNLHVSIDHVIDGNALLPIPWDEHERVGEVIGSFAQWPKSLVLLGTNEDDPMARDEGQHVTSKETAKLTSEKMHTSARKKVQEVVDQECPQQPGSYECGYYVMKWMYDITLHYASSEDDIEKDLASTVFNYFIEWMDCNMDGIFWYEMKLCLLEAVREDSVSVNARVGSGEASGSNIGYGEGGEGSNVGSGEDGEGGEGSNVLTTPTVLTMSPILSYTPGGSEEWISRVEEKFTPVIGKRFVSIEKAMKFYEIYALASGFESRKSSTKRSRDGEVRTKVLLCHREGFNKRKRRPIIGAKTDSTSGAKSSAKSGAKSGGGGDEVECSSRKIFTRITKIKRWSKKALRNPIYDSNGNLLHNYNANNSRKIGMSGVWSEIYATVGAYIIRGRRGRSGIESEEAEERVMNSQDDED